ncbi:MAG: class II aldolase/adducin family protein [Rhodospirillaceae bacterium]|nr:class II aldolase/adducin family protein [Rhodospirillaceae bacterium]MBT5455848.1 class II aldolase/adducin family protein [Rhodospirillaceae bacterium]
MAKSLAALEEEESLRGKVSEAEWNARVELAAAFRICYMRGWNTSTGNHMTSRVADQPDHFLMNASDFAWDEITASNLLKLDMDGKVVSHSSRKPRPAGLNFHSAIQREMPGISSSLHLHPMAGIVVSAMEDGLMYFDQNSCALYNQVTYHDYEGLAQEADEAPRILSDLGDKYVMIMKNHGLLTIGRTIPETLAWMGRIAQACETQERLLATGAAPRHLSQEVVEWTHKQQQGRSNNEPIGDVEFQAALRRAARQDPSFMQ